MMFLQPPTSFELLNVYLSLQEGCYLLSFEYFTPFILITLVLGVSCIPAVVKMQFLLMGL